MEREADVVVIGGGIVGTATLAALARYDLKCVLVEKEPDVAAGTTKANSAILHAGFDAPTGSMKARMNVEGNRLYHELRDELDLDIEWTGSFVCATTEEEEAQLQELKKRGEANGVSGLEIWSGDKVREKEPNLSSAIRSALWAPTAGLCWPFGLAAAFAENAMENGAEIMRDCEVTDIRVEDGKIAAVETTEGAIRARFVVNAAGVFADKVAAMAGDNSFSIRPRKGEYVLFDKTAQEKDGKGHRFPGADKDLEGNPRLRDDAWQRFRRAERAGTGKPRRYRRDDGGHGRDYRGREKTRAGAADGSGDYAVRGHSRRVRYERLYHRRIEDGKRALPRGGHPVAGADFGAGHREAFIGRNRKIRRRAGEKERGERPSGAAGFPRAFRRGAGGADKERRALRARDLPLRDDHRGRDRGRDSPALRRSNGGRREEAHPRGHGTLPGRFLRAARDRDPFKGTFDSCAEGAERRQRFLYV